MNWNVTVRWQNKPLKYLVIIFNNLIKILWQVQHNFHINWSSILLYLKFFFCVCTCIEWLQLFGDKLFSHLHDLVQFVLGNAQYLVYTIKFKLLLFIKSVCENYHFKKSLLGSLFETCRFFSPGGFWFWCWFFWGFWVVFYIYQILVYVSLLLCFDVYITRFPKSLDWSVPSSVLKYVWSHREGLTLAFVSPMWCSWGLETWYWVVLLEKRPLSEEADSPAEHCSVCCVNYIKFISFLPC